jgi:hypothetical protein
MPPGHQDCANNVGCDDSGALVRQREIMNLRNAQGSAHGRVRYNALSHFNR